MKIIDGIKKEGKRIEIPNCSRDDLPEFFKEMGYKVGIELGVYKGEFTKKLLDAGLKVYGIDPYGNFVSKKRYPDFRERQEYLKNRSDKLLDKYTKNGQYKLIRKKSMDALSDFENESIDFIYIDADHRFKYIAEDLYHWAWKVKKGGTISGHDYFNTVFEDSDEERHLNEIVHVKAIVDAYTNCFVKGSWYLIGRMEKVKDEVRDKWLSWMWIKE